MSLNFSNFIRTTLRAPVTPSDTKLLLESGSASLFSIPAGDYMYVTVNDSSTVEVMKYTSIGPVIDDTIPVLRGQDGTTAKAFPSGSCVQVAWNKAQLSEFVVQLYNQMFDAALLGSDTIEVTMAPTAQPPGGVYYAVKIDTHQLWYWHLNGPFWIEIGNIGQGIVVTTSPPSAAPAANVRFAVNTADASLWYWNNGTWIKISGAASGAAEIWTRKTTHTTAVVMPSNATWDASHFTWTDDVRWQANPATQTILQTDASLNFKLNHDAIVRVSCGVAAARTTPGAECIGTLVLASNDPLLVTGEWGTAWNFETTQSQKAVVLNAVTSPILLHANSIIGFNIINDQISQAINIDKIFFSIEVIAQQ